MKVAITHEKIQRYDSNCSKCFYLKITDFLKIDLKKL